MVDDIQSVEYLDKGIVESSSELFTLREANLSMIFLMIVTIITVSYTHLTLPTIRMV